jgi:hypothetical protein
MKPSLLSALVPVSVFAFAMFHAVHAGIAAIPATFASTNAMTEARAEPVRFEPARAHPSSPPGSDGGVALEPRS